MSPHGNQMYGQFMLNEKELRAFDPTIWNAAPPVLWLSCCLLELPEHVRYALDNARMALCRSLVAR